MTWVPGSSPGMTKGGYNLDPTVKPWDDKGWVGDDKFFLVLLLLSFHGLTMESRCMRIEKRYDLGSRVKPGNDRKINPPHQLRWFAPSVGGELSGISSRPTRGQVFPPPSNPIANKLSGISSRPTRGQGFPHPQRVGVGKVLLDLGGQGLVKLGQGVVVAHNDKGNILRARYLRKNMTDTEQRFWYQINRKQLGVKFRRQHPIGPFIVDFVCLEKKLVIELDGDQHATNVVYDNNRTDFIEAQGFTLIRIPNAWLTHEGIKEVIYTLHRCLAEGLDVKDFFVSRYV